MKTAGEVFDKCFNYNWISPNPKIAKNLTQKDMWDLSKICYDYLNSVKLHRVKFVDLGACIGTATSILASYAEEVGGDVYSVDIFADRPDWPGVETKKCWEENIANLGLINHVLLYNNDSLSVSKCFQDETIDIAYIDASHIYNDIKADIEAWWPKIKKGGILAGHDCELIVTNEEIGIIKSYELWDKDDMIKINELNKTIHAGVVVATKEFFGEHLNQRNHTWWVNKAGHP